MSPVHYVIVAYTSFICCGELVHGNDTQDFSVKKHSALVVCYYRATSMYRPDLGNFNELGIDPNLCSHIIYAFVGLNNSTYEISSLDNGREFDVEKDGKGIVKGYLFHKVVTLKKSYPHLKIMIAIGGWEEGSRKYSDMVSVPERRQKFITSVIEFLHTYRFDGLDLHWKGPAYRDGRPEDKENFVELLKEMKPIFESKGLLLSTAIPSTRSVIDAGFDVKYVARYSDFLTVMSYSYHGAWRNTTGLYSPLYDPEPDPDWGRSVNFTIPYLLQKGAPAHKLTLGLSFLGHTFILIDKDDNGIQAPSSRRTLFWRYTQMKEYIAYFEICHEFQQPGWTIKFNESQKVPYAFKENEWLSYEDEYSVDLKVKYAVDQGLGGVNIWSIDADDFSGICGRESFPLTKTINRAFNKYIKMRNDKCCNSVSKIESAWTIWTCSTLMLTSLHFKFLNF